MLNHINPLDISEILMNGLTLGVIFIDRHYNIIRWNSWMEKHSDARECDMIGQNIFERYPEIQERNKDQYITECIEKKRPFLLSPYLHHYIIPLVIVKDDQNIMMFQNVKIYPLNECKKTGGAVIIIGDLTEQVLYEKEISRLNRILKEIRNIDQLIAKVQTEDELMEGACNILLEDIGYSLCWIGLREGESFCIKSVAGIDPGIVKGFMGRNYDDCIRTCPVMKTKKNILIKNYSRHQLLSRCCLQMHKELNIQSACCLPLKIADDVFGILHICSTDENIFQAEELDLLKDVAADISFAVKTLEERKKRKQAEKEKEKLQNQIRQKNIELQQEIAERKRSEEALRKSEHNYRNIFQNAPIGIFQTSFEGKIISVNPCLSHMLGYSSPEDFISSVPNLIEQIYVRPASRNDLLKEILANTEWTRAELEVYRKDRTIAVLENTVRAVRNVDGVPLYAEGFIKDITDKKRQRDAFKLEMSRAKDIYDLVLEPRMPIIDGVGINVNCIPADSIGGDVMEIIKTGEKKFILFLADVTGHGIPAAITANTLKMLFSEISEKETDPAEICRHLNKTMHKIILPDDVISVFCGLIDTKAMTLEYYLSGLPFPLIFRNQDCLSLEPTGLPLGIFKNLLLCCKVFKLERDDLLLAFTDGITEAQSRDGNLFGNQGVKSSMGEIKFCIDSLVDNIVKEACQFQQKDSFKDDVMMIALHFDGKKKTDTQATYNAFRAPNKILFKMKTRHICIDKIVDLIMKLILDKLPIPSGRLKQFRISFFEILVNAVEHGNLNMTCFKKNLSCYESNDYKKILKNRMNSEKYGERIIYIECLFNSSQIKISIEDEGKGFDLARVPDPLEDCNITLPSGRGIAIAKISSDMVRFNSKGNKATLIKYI